MTIVRWGPDEAREKVVAGLKEGETSPVFQSSEGWEVIRVERRVPNKMMGMDKASSFIRGTIERRKRSAAEEALRASLRAAYDARVLACAPTIDSLKAAAKVDDATPCATWRGGKLTASELAKQVHVEKLEETPALYEKNRAAVVDELLDRELVKLEAQAKGYPRRPEIAARVKRRQDDLVEAKLYQDWVIKKVAVTDDEVKAYYAAHLDAFKDEQKFELAQIVVETPEAAAEVEAKLKAKEPFEELVTAYTLDRVNADKGGYVGVLTKTQLDKDFSAVTALAEGQVSPPVQSKRGYHIVKVLAIKPEHQQTFEEARDAAREKALEEQRKASQKRWVTKLRESATIEVSQAGIAAYQEEQLRRLREEEARKAAAKEAAEKKAAAQAAPAVPVEGAPAPAAPAVPAPPAEAKPAAKP
jgi:parvulin-like peptidyl-prolyl isomerase